MTQNLEQHLQNNSTAVEETKEEYITDVDDFDTEEIREDESFDFSMKREAFEQSTLAQKQDLNFNELEGGYEGIPTAAG